ncbi:MAG: hypothetical protein H6737_26425 [Alphaproteobacteria bacterium]|nr:hypothetical protein [Alphaproteobacteria bacterium]
MLFALALLACKTAEDPEAGPPLGMILDEGTFAGAAVIDVTPEIVETFTDLNGNNDFNGCLDDPTCNEPFTDADGDGIFEPVWIGGYGPLRPAIEVHDPITVRATVISHDGEYIAFVSLDLVGLGSPRIEDARARLAEEGFAADHLIASSSHNHDGPDTMGLWGNPFIGVTGRDLDYQQRISHAIDDAVRQAAAAMEPVDLKVGRTRMRDRGPWFSGERFGGKNPSTKMHGMIYDGRDPVVISDQLLVLQGNGQDGTVFTLTNWSGHPEVRGSSNNALSSDWVGVTREVLEDTYGGIALHVPESLGGMQSALNGDLPLVQPDGTHVFQTCAAADIADDTHDCFGAAEGSVRVDADGDEVPAWAEKDSWEFVTSHGWHIAEAAVDALIDGEAITPSPIRVEREFFNVAVENDAYRLFGPQDLFDLNFDDGIDDPALCPEVAEPEIDGCITTSTSRLQIGPITFVAVPGELLPELAWGFPEEDPEWTAEVASTAPRGPGARYFPQHPRECDTVDYTECRLTDNVGACDCYKFHAVPYRLSDGDFVPMLDTVDTEYKAVIGMANDYLSYIIPEPDFNRDVSLLGGEDGDHYEDTVSPASNFATRMLEAQDRILERW